MSDWIQARVWLLLAIGLVCWVPLIVIKRYWTMSSLNHERPQGRYVAISIATVCLCVATAIFIFTPQAEAFARSPQFVPTLLVALAAFSTYSTLQGFLTGSAEPLLRASLGPYSRDEHPKRFWASQAWNVLITALMVWGAFSVQVMRS